MGSLVTENKKSVSLSSAVSQPMQLTAKAMRGQCQQQQVDTTETVLTTWLSIVSCNDSDNWNDTSQWEERWKHHFCCEDKKARKYHTMCNPTESTSSDVS